MTIKSSTFEQKPDSDPLSSCETLYGAIVDGEFVLLPDTPENAAEWKKHLREVLRPRR